MEVNGFWIKKQKHEYKKTLKTFSSKTKNSTIARKYKKVELQIQWLEICNKIYLTEAKGTNLSI